MLSILAGVMIALGGIVYLSVGGIAGALLFSMGLLTILAFKFELFTGKASLLSTKQIKIGKLLEIWIGNFIGTLFAAFGILFTPAGTQLTEKAMVIIAAKTSYSFSTNLLYGVFCGLLMYIAVQTYSMRHQNALYAMLPVAIFILCGFNHCIADMFYLHMGGLHIKDYWILIPTTIGNLIGCNIIPFSLDWAGYQS